MNRKLQRNKLFQRPVVTRASCPRILSGLGVSPKIVRQGLACPGLIHRPASLNFAVAGRPGLLIRNPRSEIHYRAATCVAETLLVTPR